MKMTRQETSIQRQSIMKTILYQRDLFYKFNNTKAHINIKYQYQQQNEGHNKLQYVMQIIGVRAGSLE